MPDVSEQSYCSLISQAAGEPLYGSATPTRSYLLLEYNGPWGAKALEESRIPDRVRDHLKSVVKGLPAAKLLLIKSARGLLESGISFYVSTVEETRQALYIFHLQDYSELLDLDIPAVLAGASAHNSDRTNGPLILVCTNGRRDLCCAKFGTPVYTALRSATRNSLEPVVWHSSHMGGHRFATNLLCLPGGVLYGRVEVGDVPAILEACQHGEVHLPRLRGRTCYERPVQAADYFLRSQSGDTSLGAFHLQGAQQIDGDNWRVSFVSKKTAAIHQIGIAVETSLHEVFDGCALDKTTPIQVYRLASYAVL